MRLKPGKLGSLTLIDKIISPISKKGMTTGQDLSSPAVLLVHESAWPDLGYAGVHHATSVHLHANIVLTVCCFDASMVGYFTSVTDSFA
jgi:hypothetical protein